MTNMLTVEYSLQVLTGLKMYSYSSTLKTVSSSDIEGTNTRYTTFASGTCFFMVVHTYSNTLYIKQKKKELT